MPSLRPLLALLLALGLTPLSAAPARGTRVEAVARVNAWQLMAAARSAIADLGRRMDDPKGGFDRRRPEQVELRASLVRFNGQLAMVESHFRARDPQVFTLLEAGSRGLGELRVRWSRAGVTDRGFAASLRSLSAAYRRLRSVYGREGLRFRQGPPLTEGEQQHFDRLRQGTLIFVARLQALRQEAVRRGDQGRAAEIDRFLAAADRVATAEADLPSYLNTTMANDEMAGEWTAEGDDLRQLDAGGWKEADEVVSQLYVESDIGHVFQLDLGDSQDWGYLDQPTEVDLGAADEEGEEGDDPPRMQVFHLAGEGPGGLSRFEAGPAAGGPGGEGEAGAHRDGEPLGTPPGPEGEGEGARDGAEPREAAPIGPAEAWDLFRALLRVRFGRP